MVMHWYTRHPGAIASCFDICRVFAYLEVLAQVLIQLQDGCHIATPVHTSSSKDMRV